MEHNILLCANKKHHLKFDHQSHLLGMGGLDFHVINATKPFFFMLQSKLKRVRSVFLELMVGIIKYSVTQYAVGYGKS